MLPFRADREPYFPIGKEGSHVICCVKRAVRLAGFALTFLVTKFVARLAIKLIINEHPPS